MNRAAFERLVAEALSTIPARFRREMKNVAVIVDDHPSPAQRDAVDLEPEDVLFGLYEGIPLTERAWAQGNVEPDRITIFQRAIEEACESDDEIVVTIGETLIHEFGHYFGLSEEEIEEIEERYWRGEA
ncbi:MAG: metallopeptidase family protein [Vicinamibacterales bacterium]